MAYVAPGLKEIYISSNTTFPTTLTDAIGFGIRNAGEMTIDLYNPQEAGLQKLQFPTLVNFKIEAETLQADNAALYTALLAGAQSGTVSTAVVTSGVTKTGTTPNFMITSSTGGLFLFQTNDCLGVDFEVNITQQTRMAKITLERAFIYDTAKASGTALALIEAAKTNEIDFVTETFPMIDETKLITGYITPSYVPATLSTSFGSLYLSEFSISIKTQSQKNQFNVSRASGIEVELSATALGNDVDALVSVMTSSLNSSAITVDIGTCSFIFGKKGLSLVGNASIGDESRSSTVKYVGRYDIGLSSVSGSNVSFNTFLA